MDDLVNEIALELTQQMADAIENHPGVLRLREKAWDAGMDIRISLEALMTFINLKNQNGKKVEGGLLISGSSGPKTALVVRPENKPRPIPKGISANDRRFLRSLRISDPEQGASQSEVE